MNEIIKVSKPLPNSEYWVIRDVNNSRVKRVKFLDIPDAVRHIMRNVNSCHFMGVYSIQKGEWTISTQVVQGEVW